VDLTIFFFGPFPIYCSYYSDKKTLKVSNKKS